MNTPDIKNSPRQPVLSLGTYALRQAGVGVAHILPDFDYETYSEADLTIVGAACYSEHESTEVLCMAYDLKNGLGPQLWIPGEPNPIYLFNYLAAGGLLEAHNASFEYQIWNNVCTKKYAWPHLNLSSLRCSAAKARAFGLPGSLDKLGAVLQLTHQKDKRGKTLIKHFCSPQKPTKNNPATRNYLNLADEKSIAFLEYCVQDIRTEAEASKRIPDLEGDELLFWQCDQIINSRGVKIDLKGVENCISIIEKAYKKYNKELSELTNGHVSESTEVAKIRSWMKQFYNVYTNSLDEESVIELLKQDTLPIRVRRVLEIRQLLGGSAVKKLYAMREQVCRDGRLRNLFMYHGARTGRAAGVGLQPQNLPKEGPKVNLCTECGGYYGSKYIRCQGCSSLKMKTGQKWNAKAVENALSFIATRDLSYLSAWGDNPIDIVSGCIRGLLVAQEGHNLICSDYSAIEAVVLAALAGEDWRMEVFRTHGQIYAMSASKISGVPFQQFIKHLEDNDGQHHPLRNTVGKVAELASGYQGWIGAWKQFGADEFFTDDQMKEAILKWRNENPKIVEFWGGQFRRKRPELYGIEGAAIQAIMYPGKEFSYNGITYFCANNVLYCRLLSSRMLTYHEPQLQDHPSRPGLLITFKGVVSKSKGPSLWGYIDTYGGKLVENIVQATARDILANAIINLERAGYPVVLHIHDEIVCEVPEGKGSVAELERIMSTMPDWCKNWPVKAKGGWIGKRYRKD